MVQPADLHRSRRPFFWLDSGAFNPADETPAAASEVAKPALRFVAELKEYAPREQVSGTITLWGHGSFKRDFMGPLVHA